MALINKLKTKKTKAVPIATLHKKLANLSNPCGNKKHLSRHAKERTKWGVSYCDTYGMHYSLGLLMSNALTSYVFYAKNLIVREDWGTLEAHAKAIKEFAEADSWDDIRPRRHSEAEYRNDMARYKARLAENEAIKKAGGKVVAVPMKPRRKMYMDSYYDERMAKFRAYQVKKKAWKDAMTWLTKHWNGLWW